MFVNNRSVTEYASAVLRRSFRFGQVRNLDGLRSRPFLKYLRTNLGDGGRNNEFRQRGTTPERIVIDGRNLTGKRYRLKVSTTEERSIRNRGNRSIRSESNGFYSRIVEGVSTKRPKRRRQRYRLDFRTFESLLTNAGQFRKD